MIRRTGELHTKENATDDLRNDLGLLDFPQTKGEQLRGEDDDTFATRVSEAKRAWRLSNSPT